MGGGGKRKIANREVYITLKPRIDKGSPFAKPLCQTGNPYQSRIFYVVCQNVLSNGKPLSVLQLDLIF